MASIKVNLSGGRGTKPRGLFREDGRVAEKPHLSSDQRLLKTGFFCISGRIVNAIVQPCRGGRVECVPASN